MRSTPTPTPTSALGARLRRRTRTANPTLIAVASAAALLLAAIGSTQARATEHAILAGGCFWCVESDMDAVPGVLETR